MKNIRSIILAAFLLLFTACKLFDLESVPYIISGDFVMEENSSDYEICGVDFFLINKTEKEIKKIKLVFFLFDQDGEPAYECQSRISLDIDISVMGKEKKSFCLCLDNFLNSIPENYLFVDYLYLAEIEYEDGSVWEDPFGLIAFM